MLRSWGHLWVPIPRGSYTVPRPIGGTTVVCVIFGKGLRHQCHLVHSGFLCMHSGTFCIRLSGIELFCFKSIPHWRGDVIRIENDIEPKKEVTKGVKPPGQHLKTNSLLLFAVNKLKYSCYVLLAALNMCCRLQTLNLIIICMTDSRVSCSIIKAKRLQVVKRLQSRLLVQNGDCRGRWHVNHKNSVVQPL